MKRALHILKLETMLEQGFREALFKKGFREVHTPIITSVSLEPFGGKSFELDYYGKKAHLAQSPQFYKQLAVQKGVKKLFTVATNIRKPLQGTDFSSEFISLDFELTEMRTLESLMDFTEKMIAQALLKAGVPSVKSRRFTVEEAKRILREHKKKFSPGLRLVAREGKMVGEIARKKYRADLVFVTDFRAKDRAFYYKQAVKDGEVRSLCFDAYFRGVEIGSGGIREEDLKTLSRQAKTHYGTIGKLGPYLALFRKKLPHHGGVSIVPSRIIQALLRLRSVNEAAFFPRVPGRLTQ